MQNYIFEKLTVKIADSRAEMGKTAAADCARVLRALLSEKETVSMIFAAAPSQNETLAALAAEPGIDWSRVIAFHMDEYVGLSSEHPQSFGTYLREHIFSLLPFQAVHYLKGDAPDASEECIRYGKLLADNPVDIVCLGIGENGHIAFNDPGVADFNDTKLIKTALLDDVCRNQQVNDGCFKTIDDVPTHALTLTIPALTNAKAMFCSVPAATKRWAVTETINGEISEKCPATIMRNHKKAILYCDSASGADLI